MTVADIDAPVPIDWVNFFGVSRILDSRMFHLKPINFCLCLEKGNLMIF